MVAADSDRARLDSRRVRLPARAAAFDHAACATHEPHAVWRIRHVRRAHLRLLGVLRRTARRSLRARPDHRRMSWVGHRPPFHERADHRHRFVRNPAHADGSRGGAHSAGGAALIRDMSPRLSRALAFGLLTIGPVGANFLSNFVAGKTLPIYHTWQSQIWIMGFIAVAMYVPIVIWLCDLSSDLRMKIMKTELQALAAEGRLPAASELPTSTRDAFGRLLHHAEVWLLVLGIAANLTLYFAIQGFGPLMFTEAFHYSPAEAARMNQYFWLTNLGVLVLTGLLSD